MSSPMTCGPSAAGSMPSCARPISRTPSSTGCRSCWIGSPVRAASQPAVWPTPRRQDPAKRACAFAGHRQLRAGRATEAEASRPRTPIRDGAGRLRLRRRGPDDAATDRPAPGRHARVCARHLLSARPDDPDRRHAAGHRLRARRRRPLRGGLHRALRRRRTDRRRRRRAGRRRAARGARELHPAT